MMKKEIQQKHKVVKEVFLVYTIQKGFRQDLWEKSLQCMTLSMMIKAI